MRFEIFKFNNLTSTNDMAIDIIKNRNKDSGFVYSKNQTAGRGTQGKKWISLEGNFFGSVFFDLKDIYPPFNEFSIINPIIISDVIKKICEKEDIKLKFPNDIFINKKKFVGFCKKLLIIKEKSF